MSQKDPSHLSEAKLCNHERYPKRPLAKKYLSECSVIFTREFTEDVTTVMCNVIKFIFDSPEDYTLDSLRKEGRSISKELDKAAEQDLYRFYLREKSKLVMEPEVVEGMISKFKNKIPKISYNEIVVYLTALLEAIIIEIIAATIILCDKMFINGVTTRVLTRERLSKAALMDSSVLFDTFLG